MSELGRDDDTPRRDFEREVLKQADKEDTAPRAAEAGEAAFEKWWLANGWETHEAHSKAVARTAWAASRPAIIEECARHVRQLPVYKMCAEDVARSILTLVPLAPGEQNAAPQEETAWVVVRDVPGGLSYFDGYEFSLDNLRALRLSRREDADRYLALMHGGSNHQDRVEEHMWIGPSHEGHAAGPAAAAPVAWMFTNEEGDDDFGNNWTALADKSYRGGPAIPLYRAAPSLSRKGKDEKEEKTS